MTTVEIPTALAVTVATYLAGMYVAFVVDGWTSSQDDCDGPDVFAVVFWPLSVALIASVVAANALEGGRRFVAERFPGVARWTRLALFTLTLPFRPWRVGRLLRRRK